MVRNTDPNLVRNTDMTRLTRRGGYGYEQWMPDPMSGVRVKNGRMYPIYPFGKGARDIKDAAWKCRPQYWKHYGLYPSGKDHPNVPAATCPPGHPMKGEDGRDYINVCTTVRKPCRWKKVEDGRN